MPTVTTNMMAALKEYKVQPYAVGCAIGTAWAMAYLKTRPLNYKGFDAIQRAIAEFVWSEAEMGDLDSSQFHFGFSDGAGYQLADAYTKASETLAGIEEEIANTKTSLPKGGLTEAFNNVRLLIQRKKEAKARFAS